ncbi:phytase [Pedomonas mirosovicensis]|uniref:phytase n=1 Tax=Pedomonas mirosovicensis TaxID=2908641 RepID=UPI00216A8F50|nr:phytase [Pedomonas mirosovicensis]MCH8686331.1 phytase [Pedomonas mirosovicensis]
MRFNSMIVAASLLALAACQNGTQEAAPASTPVVTAQGETAPVATEDDAADDPAIWRNAADPAASLVIGTDKKAGIHVYNLKGERLGFTPSPRLNNVDLRDHVTINGQPSVLVAASDRADEANAKVALFRLDTGAARLDPLGSFPVGAGEAYGMCLWTRASDGALFGFLVLKDGRIDQFAIDASGAQPQVAVVRSLKLGTQAEGCVADDRTGILYVAEEDVGLWRFEADPSGSAEPVSIAKVDGKALVADVEGVALAPQGADGGYLLVSSQGDNAYAVYRLPGGEYVNRFRIGDGTVDGVSETDGIELMLGDFGPGFTEGLFVAQDGDNAPETQNFKLVDWAHIRTALGL